MSLINRIFANLKESEKATLYYAKEHQLSQYIEYAPGKFIGVNTDRIPKLVPMDTSGSYSIGVIEKCTVDACHLKLSEH
jgi:hypothetical protein